MTASRIPIAPARRRGAAATVGLYALAWLPYLVFYGLVLGYAMRLGPGMAAVAALANVLPPALLGWSVFALARRLSWRRRLDGRFAAAHLTGLVAFGAFCVAGTQAIFRLADRVRLGTWQPPQPFDWRPAAWMFLVAALLYLALAGLAYSAELVRRLRDEEARLARARELQARAELAALRARLSPHFLFNALHSLLALIRADATAAERGLERLGDLLHYVLAAPEREGEEATLGEEWAFVRDYLELEKLRFGERLRLEAALPAELAPCRVPALCLQPLVENAVRHAVGPRAGGGRVAVRAARQDGVLTIAVEDDGPGAEPAALDGEHGLGLRLVRERLHALYGPSAALVLDNRPGVGFKATLRMPATTEAR